MSTKIFITPYVQGPKPEVAMDQRPPTAQRKAVAAVFAESLSRLSPGVLWRTSVIMFTVEMLASALLLGTLAVFLSGARIGFVPALLLITAELGFVLMLLAANLALTMAQPRGRQEIIIQQPAATSRAYRVMNYAEQVPLKRPLSAARSIDCCDDSRCLALEAVDAANLDPGDVILVESGQTIQVDGKVLDGIALIDESAVTGESSPVARGSGFSTEVMRDTRVLSGRIFVQMTPRKGHRLDWIVANLFPAATTAPDQLGAAGGSKAGSKRLGQRELPSR